MIIVKCCMIEPLNRFGTGPKYSYPLGDNGNHCHRLRPCQLLFGVQHLPSVQTKYYMDIFLDREDCRFELASQLLVFVVLE